MHTHKRTFYILPKLSVTKYTNGLTKEARKTFNINWNCYYEIEIGWMVWLKSFYI